MHDARRTFLLTLGALPLWAHAQPGPVRVEGQPFERRARVGGIELLLNGTGVRAVAWFKGYAVALYLRRPASEGIDAIGQPGPKRVQIRMLQQVPAGEFAKAFRKSVENNVAQPELSRLSDRVARFSDLILTVGTVRKGDVIDLDLDPARGTVFSLNGTLRGDAVAGEDFYAALLRGFVGERPYDKKMKAGLLSPPR